MDNTIKIHKTIDGKDIEELIGEAEHLQYLVDKKHAEIEMQEKRLKELKEQIKDYGLKFFTDKDSQVSVKGSMFIWSVSKVVGSEINKKALQADGLLDKYTVEKITYRLTQAINYEYGKENNE